MAYLCAPLSIVSGGEPEVVEQGVIGELIDQFAFDLRSVSAGAVKDPCEDFVIDSSNPVHRLGSHRGAGCVCV